MKFNIERTSCMTAARKPPIDDKRVKESGVFYDILDYPDKDKIQGKIYTIELNTIDELLELVEKYGKIIVCESVKEHMHYDYFDPQPYNEKFCLEIYDDWRE